MRTKNKYIIFSVLLHFLLWAVLALLVEFDVFAAAETLESVLNKEPLVFQLQERTSPPEVVETPDDAEIEERQKEAVLASDKNARARNPEARDLDLGDAFSEGAFEFRELPTDRVPAGEPGIQAEEPVKEQQAPTPEDEFEPQAPDFQAQSQKFSREYLTSQPRTTSLGANERTPKVRFDNQESRAPDMGGFSFNTYDWDFAPYMLALKRKVEGNIFPPSAFFRLGLISGETTLRFRIYPNGKMTNLEVLGYVGHETLMQTSVKAIEISVPFHPLPTDFPEPYLEITANFHYLIDKNRPSKKG